MAAFALRRAMLPAQRVLGIGIVIEVGLPVDHAMARLAAIAQRAAVLVVLAMASVARGRHPFVLACDVTGGTFDLYVTTLKFELGFLVVIEAYVSPLAHAVAALAFQSEATLVNVILLVTSIARLRCFTILLA